MVMLGVKRSFYQEKIRVLTLIMVGGEWGPTSSMDCDRVCFGFYRLVCYMVNKKWLADAPGSPAQVKKSPKKANETPPATSAKPGCSHWIDGEL